VIKHDEPGMIGMANIDQPHTNASQFYITLAPLNGFDGHKVAFGKVVAGLKGLQHYVKQHNTQSPTLRIANCGVYNPKEILRKETTSNGIKQLPKAD
jgi:cyclophilin family peptidyl-prolyl cis-trans isomerase